MNTRELAIVLGPPGSGKTAFAVSLAVHLQRHVPVLYPSTELEQHELMARVTANVLRKPWGGIRRGTLGRERITEAIDGLNIWLLGCDVLPMAGDAAITLIEREAKWIADEQRQPPVIFVDYLQDLARGAERDMRSRVGDHARALRAMSQRLDCALVAISSVARTFYSARKAQEFREADDPTVYLAAAKESGDVDYAAARVLFLDAEDDRDKEERAVRIAVAKSRDARTGFAGARVISECGVFLPAPDVLDQMAQGGRAVEATTVVSDEADQAMFKRLVREHADGKRELCTKRYLRTGNSLGKKPVGKERAEAALDRLVQAGRASLVTIERIEGGKPKAREIYEPIGAAP
ncbi:MAG TPA: DnaB-like helicase C-terminal domain-containing protein [Kofleriaceae bacterium]